MVHSLQHKIYQMISYVTRLYLVIGVFQLSISQLDKFFNDQLFLLFMFTVTNLIPHTLFSTIIKKYVIEFTTNGVIVFEDNANIIAFMRAEKLPFGVSKCGAEIQDLCALQFEFLLAEHSEHC